ncbi:hypothetical protein X801_06120 [Opisthorchis viverrini]|uniref:Uncharacterized protein n=1 Tax=Opisthorchis viverrini TaxID=6198 RepID=A0A1S8WUD5_OPIVI|nr:hypothetical protein X801_06120 [Opisthorchis viverrini]
MHELGGYVERFSQQLHQASYRLGVSFESLNANPHAYPQASLSGEGNFNWRFIFPFDYIKAEDRIEFKDKGPFDVEPITIKSNCELTLQIWDADVFSSDNFLGK